VGAIPTGRGASMASCRDAGVWSRKKSKRPSARHPCLACTDCLLFWQSSSLPAHARVYESAAFGTFLTLDEREDSVFLCHCYIFLAQYICYLAMAPSPRKTAPSNAFTQTWDETDAAFLDPTSLPIARMPRGWERKQDTKVTAQGKQKRVWRRYTTRSRGVETPEEDEDEEQHDSRARAVKKLQRMSPGAMEQSASTRQGTQRAFKATRWDRRRSVLPSRQHALGHFSRGLTICRKEETLCGSCPGGC
jgi:hypothetical protein